MKKIQRITKHFFICLFLIGASQNLKAQHFTFDTSVGDVVVSSGCTISYLAESGGRSGVLVLTTTANEPRPAINISNTGATINATANSWVKVVYKAAATVIHHKFRFNIAGNINTVNNTLVADGTWRTAYFDLLTLGGVNWTGTGTVEFRLNSGTATDGINHVIEFDEISFVTRTTADGAIPTTADASINIEHDVTSATDVTIPSNATYRIEADKSLDITGNLITNDSLKIQPGGSLKVSGTSTGNITYNRSLNFVSGNLKGWHLVSSPVVGENYNTAWYTANDMASGSGTNRGIASYVTATDAWSYVLEAADVAFTDGVGYIMKRGTATGTVAYTGTLNVDNAGVDVTLVTTGSRFHALGNPYPSYMSSATLLGNASLSENQQIWVFDQTVGTDGSYVVKTFVNNFIIAPGQGFFVKGNALGGTVNFAESNQAIGTDTFLKSSKTEIKLTINRGAIHNYANIHYLDNATTDFDNGYEGETFTGVKNDFEIYTQLLSNNQGKNYQVQSLPNSDLEAMIIPVGLNVTAGEIVFKAQALNIPAGLKVYLEDRQKNTLTRLDEANSEYKITIKDALHGTGRFFLHTKSAAVLSTDIEILNTISIFKTDNNNLIIDGLSDGKADVSLYNLLGKKVMHTSFEANGVKEIFLPNLATGVYVVKLTTEAGKLNKKIILE